MNALSLSSSPTIALPNYIIDATPGSFNGCFNRFPFTFSHTLAGHPLFELSNLAEISEMILASGQPEKFDCSHNSGVSAGSKFEELHSKDQVAEAILQLRESNSWIKLSTLNEVIPEFDCLAKQIILELEEFTGIALHKEITWCGATIFLGSPNTVVPYHLDHEANFLFQIHGTKQVNLFDQEDRSILTEEELEICYIGDKQLNYKDDHQEKASVYCLTPGTGVHHPICAPHWVKNGDDINVMLSLNFQMRSFNLRSRIYQANYYLRKLGLEPTPPGKSIWKDNLKGLIMSDAIFPPIKRLGASTKSLWQHFK